MSRGTAVSTGYNDLSISAGELSLVGVDIWVFDDTGNYYFQYS
jgi:hypothetical protein